MSRKPKPRGARQPSRASRGKPAGPLPAVTALQGEGLFRSLAETASDAILTVDVHSIILFANRGVERVFGYAVADVLGKSLTMLMPDYLRKVHELSFARYLKTGKKHIRWEGVELTGLHRSGREIPLEVAFGEFRRGASHVFTGVVRDLSDRKHAEQRLQEREEHYHELIENAGDMIFAHDLSGRFTTVNRALCEAAGYTRDELLRLNIADLLPPGQVAVTPAGHNPAAPTERLKQPYEMEIVGKHGRRLHLEVTARLLYEDQKPVAIQGIARDVTERTRSEEALRESEAKFRALAETASCAIFIYQGARFCYLNALAEAITGYSRQEMLQRNFFDLVHPDMRDLVRQRGLARQQGQDVPPRYEIRVLTKSGDTRWLDYTAGTIVYEGQPAVLGTAFDITDRKRAELLQSALYRIAEKAGSVENLDELFAAIHAILDELMPARNCFFALHDPDTDIVSFPYFVDERGTAPPPRKAGMGLTSYVLRTGQPLLATPETIEDLVSKGEVVRSGPHSLDWMGVPLKKGEHTFGVLGLQSYEERRRYGQRELEILQFVTREVAGAIERRRYLDAVRESEERFRAIAETATSLIVIRSGSRYVYVNRAFEQVTEYSREQALALDPSRLVHPDFLELVQKRSEARLRGESVLARYEIKIVTRTGKERWLDASPTVISYAGQQSILTTAVDITERKRAELLQSALYRIAEQSRSAASLQQLYAAIHAIVGELMSARNFYIALYDPPTQTISFPYFVDEEDVTPPVKLNVGRGLTAYVLRTGQPLLATPEVFAELVRRGEAEEVGAASLDWVGVPLKRGDETFGVLVVQSYTEGIRYGEQEKEILTFVSQQVAGAIERQRSEEALRESESRFRSLVERAVYGICLSSCEGRFLSVNPALVEMLGYDSEEEVLALEIARDVYRDAGEQQQLLSTALRTGRIDNVEVEWKRKDGQSITVRLNGRVVPGQPEKPSMEFIAEDVTAQRSLEAQFRQSQKMEAVGRLAGGVAHDFNNLLTVITGYADLILRQLGSDDPMRREMGQINKAAERAALLTRQLLAFSRQQMLEPRVLQLNDVITGIEAMLRRLLGEDIRLITRLRPGLARVKADPGQMEQILMNLAVNARDAMPRGGELTIETSETVLEKSFAHDQPTVKPGSYVKLAVTDTGAGMDAETLARVFEPFFTTKERGKGTGLGLSTVYGIVKQSEGYIWAQSKPGKGASFHVYLPQVEARIAQPAELESTRTADTPGSETILVVEDEEGVRSLVRHVLHRQGYNVLEARHAGEALLLCDRYSQTIHLLLTDVILEDVSGPELARRLVVVRPQMKVLFMSGYTDDAVLRHGVQSAETPFLQKPFSTDALARKVREVLDQPVAAK